MKKVLILMALFLFFFASGAFAATDTVMLVTDMTSVDAAIATSAAAKTGVPVLVLENGLLNDATLSAIGSLSPKNVVLVGGPAVIKPEVETQLKALSYNVIRLWGMERTGTAIAVANHFWIEGTSCAVLVADTKNSDLDSARQAKATEFAAHFNCTLVPIPEGTLPSEVLNMLTDLNATNVWYVGRAAMPGLRNELKQFRYREIIGSDDDIQRAVENETNITNRTKIVVVATPDWKASIGMAAHLQSNSVARHISSLDQVPALIDFIKSRNITNVTVVGIPELAQQIADQLIAANITVTKVFGKNANEIARGLLEKNRKDWDEKKKISDAAKLRLMSMMKAQLQKALNNTQQYLDRVQAEANSLPPSDAVSTLFNAVNQSQANLTNVTALIQSGNYDAARNMLSQLKESVDAVRFARRDALGIDVNKEAKDEESSGDDLQSETDSQLSMLQGRMTQIKEKCKNTEILDSVIAKAKSLRDDWQRAKNSGDYKLIAQLTMSGKELTLMAQHIGDACSKKGVMPTGIGKIVERRGVAVQKMIESNAVEANAVKITSRGFDPQFIKIKTGDTVTFTNEDTAKHWPASNAHPTHAVYPGSGIEKCGTAEQSTVFDACKGLAQGESFSFKFDQKGSWTYHDHLVPAKTGIVVVE